MGCGDVGVGGASSARARGGGGARVALLVDARRQRVQVGCAAFRHKCKSGWRAQWW